MLPLPDGQVIVALGDVAGKGSPAALLMALLLAVLRTLVDERLEPAALVERLNAQIARHSPASRFITLFYGVYDPVAGELIYVNAGQNPPLVRRRDGRYERLAATGVALGHVRGIEVLPPQLTTVRPGELLVLYSDGITEAENPVGQPFEETGLEQVVDAYASEPPAQLAARVLAAVERHAATAQVHRRFDDPAPEKRARPDRLRRAFGRLARFARKLKGAQNRCRAGSSRTPPGRA